jgi:hypothetical protein
MVTGRKRTHPEAESRQHSENTTKNSYDILNQLLGEEEVGDPHKMTATRKKKVKPRTNLKKEKKITWGQAG